MISREGSDLSSDLKVLLKCLSDHSSISCELRMTRPVIPPRTALTRDIGNIDHAKFAQDLAVKISTLGEEHNVDAAAQRCSSFIVSFLDCHAPLKLNRQRNTKPWYTDATYLECQQRLQFKGKWLKTTRHRQGALPAAAEGVRGAH